MRFEVFSSSKFKTGGPGDDVTLFIPGVIAAVFDGATDPLDRPLGGLTSGRFAAETVALACARLFLTPGNAELPVADLVGHVADDLAQKIKGKGFDGTPATTLAIALLQDNSVRLVTVGDSGIRVNGDRVFRHEKLIDEVTASARIAVFLLLQGRIGDADRLEATTRKVAYLGLEQAARDGVLTPAEAGAVISGIQQEFAAHAIATDIEDLLNVGIRSQKRFANRGGHPLGFSALDGSVPSLADVTDTTIATDGIDTLEIFSDGYIRLPESHRIAEWEAAHRDAERVDFHKIDAYPSVKGSTSTEYFDDRSVLSIEID